MRIRAALFGLLAILILSAVTALLAETRKVDGRQDEALGSVEAEVRNLRRTVQQSASIHSRIMILTERMRISNSRLGQLVAQERLVSDQITSIAAMQNRAQRNLTAFESRLSQLGQKAGISQQLEETISATKAELDYLQELLSGHRRRHAQLTNEIRAEESTFAQLVQQISGLEAESKALASFGK
jgi:chromosome segregation ATPase